MRGTTTAPNLDQGHVLLQYRACGLCDDCYAEQQKAVEAKKKADKDDEDKRKDDEDKRGRDKPRPNRAQYMKEWRANRRQELNRTVGSWDMPAQGYAAQQDQGKLNVQKGRATSTSGASHNSPSRSVSASSKQTEVPKPAGTATKDGERKKPRKLLDEKGNPQKGGAALTSVSKQSSVPPSNSQVPPRGRSNSIKPAASGRSASSKGSVQPQLPRSRADSMDPTAKTVVPKVAPVALGPKTAPVKAGPKIAVVPKAVPKAVPVAPAAKTAVKAGPKVALVKAGPKAAPVTPAQKAAAVKTSAAKKPATKKPAVQATTQTLVPPVGKKT
jgi:hypothetical protein